MIINKQLERLRGNGEKNRRECVFDFCLEGILGEKRGFLTRNMVCFACETLC